MKNNQFIKFLCSIPVILLAMYFSRFLGICLVIFRLIAIKDSKYTLPGTLIMMGIVLLIPKGLYMISSKIPYIIDIVENDEYTKLLGYSKFLLIFGVILMIIMYLIQMASKKIDNLGNKLSNYAKKQEENRQNILKENDYKMRLRHEEIKYARSIKCKNCGQVNYVKEKVGKCSHCRTPLE